MDLSTVELTIQAKLFISLSKYQLTLYRIATAEIKQKNKIARQKTARRLVKYNQLAQLPIVPVENKGD